MPQLDARTWRDAHKPDECTPPPSSRPVSALSKADWRKLEWTIIKGVAGGVFLIWALDALFRAIGEAAMRGMP